MNKNILVFICSIVSVYLTWLINHVFGFSPILANGIVGVLAIFVLEKKYAGIAYTSSFVGMSSMAVLPDIYSVLISGVIVATVICITPTVYRGIGGKGGTTAAISSVATRVFYSLIG
jgi:hypothetical protein